MYFLSFKQQFFCVCCGSLKDYKEYFTCSKTCASKHRNKKNTHWRTAGLLCRFCVECGEEHRRPVENSFPYCSEDCMREFKVNCRRLRNSEPRDRGNRDNHENHQAAQFVLVQQLPYPYRLGVTYNFN